MEMIEVESGVAVLLSEYSSDIGGFEFGCEKGPFVAKSDHVFNTLLTFHFERCRGGGLRG